MVRLTIPKRLKTIAGRNQDAARLLTFVLPGENGCWEWHGSRNDNGYGQFYFRGKAWRAHRAAYALFTGEIPDGLFVCHHCDNPSCVNPDHLFLGHAAVNVRDMVRKGRAKTVITSQQDHFSSGHAPRGEEASGHRMTEEMAIELLDLAAQGIGPTALARRAGLSRITIQGLLRGDTWKHLPRPAHIPKRPERTPIPALRSDGVSFPSLSSAARHHGVTVKAILYAAEEPTKRRCKGFFWTVGRQALEAHHEQ